MPALYALAQHDALVEASSVLEEGERIFCFLDELHLVTSKRGVLQAFEEVASRVERHAGVKSHMGKLRMWSRAGGSAPPELMRTSAWPRRGHS